MAALHEPTSTPASLSYPGDVQPTRPREWPSRGCGLGHVRGRPEAESRISVADEYIPASKHRCSHCRDANRHGHARVFDALLTLTVLSLLPDEAVLHLVFLTSQTQSFNNLSGRLLTWHDSCTLVVAGCLRNRFEIMRSHACHPQRQSSGGGNTQDVS